MKKILVPTDFSFCAEEAAKAALQLAQVTDSEIDFLHLMDVPHDWINLLENNQNTMYPDVTQKVKEANLKLDSYVSETEKIGLTCKKYLIFNEDAKYIVKFAEDNGYDYIVMGSNGASGIREMILGSNTQKVIRESSVPVLVIKDFPIHLNTSRIVFMSDFDSRSTAGFKKLVNIAEAIDCKIHLLYVNVPFMFETTDIIEERMDVYKDLAGDRLEDSTIYNSNEYEEGLKHFLETNSDILGMVTHRSNNRLAQQIINHMSVPMFNVHIAE